MQMSSLDMFLATQPSFGLSTQGDEPSTQIATSKSFIPVMDRETWNKLISIKNKCNVFMEGAHFLCTRHGYTQNVADAAVMEFCTYFEKLENYFKNQYDSQASEPKQDAPEPSNVAEPKEVAPKLKEEPKWESARIPSVPTIKPMETPPVLKQAEEVELEEKSDREHDDHDDDEHDDTTSEGCSEDSDSFDLDALSSLESSVSCMSSEEVPELPYTAGRPLLKGFYLTGKDMIARAKKIDAKIGRWLKEKGMLVEKGKEYLKHGKTWDRILHKKNKENAKKALKKLH